MVLEDGMAERRAEAEDDSKDWDTAVGRMEGGFNNHRFSGYWNSETDMTHPGRIPREFRSGILGGVCLPAVRQLE